MVRKRMRGVHFAPQFAGVAQWLEFQPSKLAMRVRFPSPAPVPVPCDRTFEHQFRYVAYRFVICSGVLRRRRSSARTLSGLAKGTGCVQEPPENHDEENDATEGEQRSLTHVTCPFVE